MTPFCTPERESPRNVWCSSLETALELQREESGHCYPTYSSFHQPTGPALFLDNAHREITVTTWKKRKPNPDPCTRLGTSYYSSCHWDRAAAVTELGQDPALALCRRGMETRLVRLVPACMGRRTLGGQWVFWVLFSFFFFPTSNLKWRKIIWN